MEYFRDIHESNETPVKTTLDKNIDETSTYILLNNQDIVIDLQSIHSFSLICTCEIHVHLMDVPIKYVLELIKYVRQRYGHQKKSVEFTPRISGHDYVEFALTCYGSGLKYQEFGPKIREFKGEDKNIVSKLKCIGNQLKNEEFLSIVRKEIQTFAPKYMYNANEWKAYGSKSEPETSKLTESKDKCTLENRRKSLVSGGKKRKQDEITSAASKQSINMTKAKKRKLETPKTNVFTINGRAREINTKEEDDALRSEEYNTKSRNQFEKSGNQAVSDENHSLTFGIQPVVPENKGVVPQDRTAIPGNKGFVLQDGTAIPGSKGFVPQDRTAIPGNKGFVPQDRIAIPGSKGFVPQDRTAIPGNKGFVPQDRIAIPGSKGFVPQDRTAIPGNKGFVLEDRTAFPVNQWLLPKYRPGNQSLILENETVRTVQEAVRTENATVRTVQDAVRTENATARTVQEAVRTENETVRTKKGTVRKENVTVRPVQEAVRTENEALRTLQEAVRTENETVRTVQEAVRTENEAVRTKKETVRKENEAVRTVQEAVRTENEAVRTTKETVRKENEAVRTVQEAVRTENEAVRTKKETVRKENEAVRTVQEVVRTENEAVRTTKETVRKENEAVRTVQEAVRTENEVVRTTKETVITENEAVRTKNEAVRKEYETVRTKKEIVITENEAVRTEKEAVRSDNQLSFPDKHQDIPENQPSVQEIGLVPCDTNCGISAMNISKKHWFFSLLMIIFGVCIEHLLLTDSSHSSPELITDSIWSIQTEEEEKFKTCKSHLLIRLFALLLVILTLTLILIITLMICSLCPDTLREFVFVPKHIDSSYKHFPFEEDLKTKSKWYVSDWHSSSFRSWYTSYRVYPASHCGSLEKYFKDKFHGSGVSLMEEMKYEWRRLQTFKNWPDWAVHSPTQMAEEGFYSTGDKDKVVCFSCRTVIEKWPKDRSIRLEHERQSPDCKHLRNQAENYPVLDSTDCMFQDAASAFAVKPTKLDDKNAEKIMKVFLKQGVPKKSSLSLYNLAEMKDEQKRFESFKDLHFNGFKIDEFTNSGLFWSKSNMEMTCAFCRLATKDISSAVQIHTMLSPNCNKSLPAEPDRHTTTDEDITAAIHGTADIPDNGRRQQELGILSDQPKHPRYATLQSRMDSFKNWNPDMVQKPYDMALAGFVYAGVGDCVKCHHCDGGLRNWLTGDDPWVEHARWFPRCSYVLLNKGLEFVRTVDELFPRTILNSSNSGTAQSSASRQPGGHSMEAAMKSPSVKNALEMGYTTASIRKALDILNKTGQISENSVSIDSLLDVLDEIEKDNSARNTSDQRTQKEDKADATASVGSSAPSSDLAGQNTDMDTETLKQRNRELVEQTLCKICLENKMCITFLPCGHLVTCPECAPALRKCPICRSAIKGRVRVYMS